MKLSLLVAHLFSRAPLLDRLKRRLEPQMCSGVELLVNGDNGEKTTGEKRNELLRRASGEFCCFIDDDDDVSEDYISRILGAVESNPDVVGIEGIMTRGGQNPERFIHSLRYDRWYHEGEFPNRTYYRCPNHLNPVKRELALSAGFPEVTVGEDRAYSERLRPMLNTEVYLDGAVYFYLAD